LQFNGNLSSEVFGGLERDIYVCQRKENLRAAYEKKNIQKDM